MKKICLLIVLTHLVFPAFENAFKFQYLGSNLPNIQDSVQISQNKKSEKWKPKMGLQLDIVF